MTNNNDWIVEFKKRFPLMEQTGIDEVEGVFAISKDQDDVIDFISQTLQQRDIEWRSAVESLKLPPTPAEMLGIPNDDMAQVRETNNFVLDSLLHIMELRDGTNK